MGRQGINWRHVSPITELLIVDAMKPSRILLSALVSVGLVLPALASTDFSEQLRHRLEITAELQPAAGDVLYALESLRVVYEHRAWQPLWLDDGLQPNAMLELAVEALDMADEHGLDSSRYHRPTIEGLIDELDGATISPARSSILISLELLTTDAILTLGHHLSEGRIDPESIDPQWFIPKQSATMLEWLQGLEADADATPRSFLQAQLPRHAAYHTLVRRLALQREFAVHDQWPSIPGGALIRPDEVDERIESIRQRLVLLGDLDEDRDNDTASSRYDEMMAEAVRHFQWRHGLNTDAIIGSRTLQALNITPDERIGQLRANLERWRWLPDDLGDEYVLVNIAGFDMQVVSHGQMVMSQRVIVGQPYRRTPVFTGRMTYLVLNPSWEVPHRLAAQDQLPKIRGDINYLEEMGFAVLRGWGAEEVRVDPHEVDWQPLSARNFPYRLRQAPGPKNALGQVKFMFPNRHNVYLHDTPARGLFALDDRAASSGCIRLEDPGQLTEWLLIERDGKHTAESIRRIIESGAETTVRLDRAIPVHLLYWTAWVDDDGIVHNRHDVYQRDVVLVQALDAPPPEPDSEP